MRSWGHSIDYADIHVLANVLVIHVIDHAEVSASGAILKIVQPRNRKLLSHPCGGAQVPCDFAKTSILLKSNFNFNLFKLPARNLLGTLIQQK